MKQRTTTTGATPSGGETVASSRLPDPRQDAYDRLPKWPWFQALITSIYGVPYPGQCPLFRQTPLSVAAVYLTGLIVSVTVATILAACWPTAGMAGKAALTFAVGVCFLITAGRLRACHHTLLHHASHGDFGRFNRWIGELASMLAFTMPLDEYRPKHMYHHAHTADDDDPELETVIRLGFLPGLHVNFYWKRLVWALTSPRMLAMHFGLRWRSNIGRGVPAWRKLVVAILHGAPLALVLALATAQHRLLPFVVYLAAWLLPWTAGVYMSLVLYVLGLHLWFLEPTPGLSHRAIYVQRTGARFFGDSLPDRNLPRGRYYARLAWWWVRLIGLHLLISRLFCVSGNNQQHDVHHMEPKKLDWCNAAYDRERLAAQGKDAYWHTWGLFPALRRTFNILAAMPARSMQPIPYRAQQQALAETELM